MGLTDGRDRLEEKSVEVSTGFPQKPSGVLALQKYVPENVVYALAVFDTLMALESHRVGRKGAEFTPTQCLTDSSMASALRVIPVPYAALSGELELAAQFAITTAGVSAEAAAKGSITGQYGSYKLEGLKKEVSSGVNTGSKEDSGEKAPGIIGLISGIIGALDYYVSDGADEIQKRDLTEHASGVTLSKSLKFSPKGFELTAKSGSPDLEIKIGTMTSEFAVGVTGKLDFIDALARKFGGPGAELIQKARARMKNGETIKGTLEAYLELGATGTLTHNIESGMTLTIPATGDMDLAKEEMDQTFEGEIKIHAKAEIRIQVGVDLWIFEGEAGASGSVHTSWKWSMRLQDKEPGNKTRKRQKKFEFEGVILNFQAYIKSAVRNSREQSNEFEIPKDNDINDDIFKRVADGIGDSRRAAIEISQESYNRTRKVGKPIEIWGPTPKKEVIWKDY